MSQFRFGLQRVLDLRQQRENEMASRLNVARNAAEEARRRQDSIEGACTDGRAHIAQISAEGATRSAGELQYLSLVLEHLSGHALAAQYASAAADAQLDQSATAFAAAARARQVLDQLRERHHTEWRQEQSRADRQAMDAVALTRHITTSRSRTGTEG